MMFVVTVSFVLKPDKRESFLQLILENARQSVSQEPGCQRFDVCENPDKPEEIFLYEVYDDHEAFKAHKTMQHYLDFSAGVAGMVADKSAQTFALLT